MKVFIMRLFFLSLSLLLVFLLSSSAEGKKKRHGKKHEEQSREISSKELKTYSDRVIDAAHNLYKKYQWRGKGRDESSNDSSRKRKGKRHGKSGSWSWPWNRNSQSSSESGIEFSTTTSHPNRYAVWSWSTVFSKWWSKNGDGNGYNLRPIWKRGTTPQPYWENWDDSDSSSDDDDLWWWIEDSDESDSDSKDSSESKSKSKKKPHGHKKKHSHGKSKEKHSHGKSKEKHSHRHSKESSKSNSRESSGSSEWSSEGSDSSEEVITPEWCERWCYKWASHLRNLIRVIPYSGARFFRQRDAMIKEYCRALIAEHDYCNANMTTNYTTEMTTPGEVMTSTTGRPRPRRRCLNYRDCERDECCASISRHGSYCTRLSEKGQKCSQPIITWQSASYARWCPCESGLDCQPNISFQSKMSIYSWRSRSNFGVCRQSGTTDAPTTATAEVTSGMTTESVTTINREVTTTDPRGTRMTTTDPVGSTINITTDPTSNTTLAPPNPCETHMDCPFFQCCTNVTTEDFSGGFCAPFSNEGEFCSRLDTFSEFPIIDACPCQSFLSCRKANTDEDERAFGICV